MTTISVTARSYLLHLAELEQVSTGEAIAFIKTLPEELPHCNYDDGVLFFAADDPDGNLEIEELLGEKIMARSHGDFPMRTSTGPKRLIWRYNAVGYEGVEVFVTYHYPE